MRMLNNFMFKISYFGVLHNESVLGCKCKRCYWLSSCDSFLCFLTLSGLIGRSWAMLFASGGFKVKLYDIEQQQITNALENIR